MKSSMRSFGTGSPGRKTPVPVMKESRRALINLAYRAARPKGRRPDARYLSEIDED